MTAEGGIPFGQYTLLRRIARGGMAEVFLAKQRGLEGFDRHVAVKRILPHLADSPEFLKMFLEEARLAARITHPNIVHIYEFGKYGDDYFIAMEFVDGVHAGEIASISADRPMPWGLLARIGADTASALHFAHQLTDENGRRLGLVHRDISPANILVSYSGTAKIVDFGIAKAVEISDQRTNPGTVKGKFTYMSPEQTIGAQLDGRSDIFSLAIVLWEMATGKPLIDRGDPGAAMRSIRDGKFPPVQSVVPSIPPPLAQAIAWAMEVDRDRRATALDLAQALEAYIKASPELANAMQLGAWISRELPPHSVGDDDAADDSYDFAPRTNAGHTEAGPRTMAGPPTAAASVADIVKSLRVKQPQVTPPQATPPLARRPVPLAGIPGIAEADDGYETERHTFAELPATPSPIRKRVHHQSASVPVPAQREQILPPRPKAAAPDRQTADLSEEMARTGIFQPRDPAELDDTVERKREAMANAPGTAPVAVPARPHGLPGVAAYTRRPAPPPQPEVPPTAAGFTLPRRGQSTVPPPFRNPAPPPRTFEAVVTRQVAPLPATTRLDVPNASDRLFASGPRRPRSKLPWVVGVGAAVLAVGGVWLARSCSNNGRAVGTSEPGVRADARTMPSGNPADAEDTGHSLGATTDAGGRDGPTLLVPIDAALIHDSKTPTTRPLPPLDAVTETLPTPSDVAVIEVSSEPSHARVLLGDRSSTTPARFETKGEAQLIVVELPGYERHEQRIAPQLGQVARVVVTLKPLSSNGITVGRVALRSTPSSEVFEGRRSLGRTPLNIELAIGTHTLFFRATKYQPATRTLRIKATGNPVVAVKLSK